MPKSSGTTTTPPSGSSLPTVHTEQQPPRQLILLISRCPPCLPHADLPSSALAWLCCGRDQAFQSVAPSVASLERVVRLRLLHADLHHSLMDVELVLFGACVLSHYIPARSVHTTLPLTPTYHSPPSLSHIDLFSTCYRSRASSGFGKARHTVQALQARLVNSSVREAVQAAVTDLKEIERGEGTAADIQRKMKSAAPSDE